MGSDNPIGADNQQERPGFEQWIVGFVDGEGCFSISVVRNRLLTLGWQVQHEFSVTHAASSESALRCLHRYFGGGTLIESTRTDNHREPLMRYSVKDRPSLLERIIPFFEEHPLMTAKKNDFELFTSVLRSLRRGEYLRLEELKRIAQTTERMNRRRPSRILESSEAIRQPSHGDI